MYDFKAVEEEINAFWKKIELLKKLEEKNKDGESYFLLDGPPYANFVPHVGHVRSTVYKDVPIRLAYMQGRNVLFQPGFDTHGLPIENKVEKDMKLHSKKDIEKLGVNKFMKACKEHAVTNIDAWLNIYEGLGVWVAWKEPYRTYDQSYVESGWWTFKQLYEKGLVYEGKKPVFWCPRCETALAGYEVTDSYKMLTDPAIFIKFKLKEEEEEEEEEEYLLVYTTTPWTLTANVAVAVNPNEDYVKVKTTKGTLILAKERLELLEKLELEYTIIQAFKGEALVDTAYEPLLDVPQQEEIAKNPKAHKIIASIPLLKERVASKTATKKNVEAGDVFEDFVVVTEGTGLVHCAPGHGKTDNEIGKHYNLPEASPVTDQGIYTDMAGEFEGLFVKKADKSIMEKLEKTEKLLHYETTTHKYPVCWRCKSPLLFRMSKQWFLKVDPVREKLLGSNEVVRWLPGFAKERMENWIANAEDWNISRQRYWGIPIPIWRSEEGELEVIGSLEELEKRSGKKLPANFDIHTASSITFTSKSGKEMKRVNDIFDVWFDSGIAPWASLGYPMQNKVLFESHFPISKVTEGQDQIRGWFYHLLFCGVATFDKNPLEEISLLGWVLDSKGEKMSKSVGNVLLAGDALKDYGADALRFYYMWDIAPYDTQRFNKLTLEKEVKKILNVFWNVKNYYLNLNSKIKGQQLELQTEDRWILSKLHSLIMNYHKSLHDFEYHQAAREIGDFILNTLSREYIQMTRDRSNGGDAVVIETLRECLIMLSKLLAPIAPFITDKIYQELGNEGSVHLETFPLSEEILILKDIEKEMEEILGFIESLLSERDKIKMGIRWPLQKATVFSKNAKNLEKFAHIIKKQVNVKEVEFREGEGAVHLETLLTPDLEKEGYSRELARRVQALRKQSKLQRDDKIELYIKTDLDLSAWAKELKEKVGAGVLTIQSASPTKDFEKSIEEKIKGKSFQIALSKL